MMTIAAARSTGVPTDHQVARTQLASIASYIDVWREPHFRALASRATPIPSVPS